MAEWIRSTPQGVDKLDQCREVHPEHGRCLAGRSVNHIHFTAFWRKDEGRHFSRFVQWRLNRED